ncbi:hypothetical protein HC031_24500 [Planosporangium thailandense]|uniref:DUF3592 domain-containing protein n=1 Tax=Planosporangium thailandense TaxID=765197 RepID=A0ABX0Y393_9ACTN|nr:hypothetical protein [Planosporangium thailandense]NJC72855.1 hypothetical protein [Planosporangium thailandense]
MAKERVDPAAAADDEDRGSWHLRGVGSWAFALALWLAATGGVGLFSREGIEVALARLGGVPGTVTIENCAHSSSYALCYGPFSAADGSVRRQRIELRTLRHDRPGAVERTWLPDRSATHAWAGDISPWRQLLPAAPFALLTLIQTVWIMLSWRAWRRRRRLTRDENPPAAPTRDDVVRHRETTPPRPVGVARPPAATGAPTPAITISDRGHPLGAVGGADRRQPGWQDLRGTAAPPGPSIPQQRDRPPPWERPEHG